MAQFIPLAIMAAGAVIKGMQQNAAAKGAAQAMEANARSTRLGTAAEEESQRRQSAMMMGDVRASAAQSGFDPSSGSLATLQTKTAGELELESLTTRYRGELQALGMDYDAKSTRAAGKQAQSNGYLSAAATLYSGQMQNTYVAASRIGKS
jgi:hypothetical protein